MSWTTSIEPIRMMGLQGLNAVKDDNRESGDGSSIFKDVLQNTVDQVKTTQADVENKQYLLATGQLEDAHSLPIAETKAQVSLDLLISLRNKAMESYSEIMKMSV